jgi:hypothetical protein
MIVQGTKAKNISMIPDQAIFCELVFSSIEHILLTPRESVVLDDHSMVPAGTRQILDPNLLNWSAPRPSEYCRNQHEDVRGHNECPDRPFRPAVCDPEHGDGE